jgi:hypothetical protein
MVGPVPTIHAFNRRTLATNTWVLATRASMTKGGTLREVPT